MNTLKNDHAKSVCRFGQGKKCCSFLVMGEEGFACVKGTDNELFMMQRRALGMMNAMGNYCDGPPDFTLIPEYE